MSSPQHDQLNQIEEIVVKFRYHQGYNVKPWGHYRELYTHL